MLAAIAAFLAPAWGWIIAGIGLLAALVGAYFKGHSNGVQAQQQTQIQGRLDAIETKRKSDEAINNASPSDLDKRLNPWMRP